MNQLRERDREPPQDPPDGSELSLDTHYGSSSSNGDVRPRKRRVDSDNLKDLITEAPEFDGSLKPEDCHGLVQAMERIIEIKEYSR